MLFASIFAMIVGFAMIVQWLINIIGNRIPRLDDNPVSIIVPFSSPVHQ